MSQILSIPGRFNGPQASGQGGYCSGLIASFVEGPASVTLRSPIPLETPLEVIREDDGSVRVLAGETLVAEAHSAPELDLEVPGPVRIEEARLAKTRYRGLADGPFSHCFVCGRAREDAIGVFAGSVEGRKLAASSWTPPDWTAGEGGHVLPEFIWAVLDCPTFFALEVNGELPMSVLARMTARVDAPVMAGQEHVAIAWPIDSDGHKHHAGSAVVSPEGDVLVVARALLIEPREGLG